MKFLRKNLADALAAIDADDDARAAADQAVLAADLDRRLVAELLDQTELAHGLLPEQTAMLRDRLAAAEAAVTAAAAERDAMRADLKARLDALVVPARLDAAKQILQARELLAAADATISHTGHAYRRRRLAEPLPRLRSLAAADAQAALDEHAPRARRRPPARRPELRA